MYTYKYKNADVQLLGITQRVGMWVYTCTHACRHTHTYTHFPAVTLCTRLTHTHTHTLFMSKKMLPTQNISRLQVWTLPRIFQWIFKAVNESQKGKMKLEEGKKQACTLYLQILNISKWLILHIVYKIFFLPNFLFILKTISFPQPL